MREKFKLRCHLRYYGVQKGGQDGPTTPLPYMPISSSNGVCTGGFGGSDQKQPLWTSIVSECARPNINTKINGKRFFGLLDTGSNITIISKRLWPKSWPIQRITCQTAGVSQTKAQEVYQSVKYIHVRDQKASLLM